MKDERSIELSGRSKGNVVTLLALLLVFTALLIQDAIVSRAITVLTFGTGCLLFGQLCRVMMLKVRLNGSQMHFRTVWGRSGEAQSNYVLGRVHTMT